MRYDVDVGGVTKHVTVVRAGDGFAVTLDGQTFQIDAARIDGHTLSLLVDRVWPDGRSLTPGLTPSLIPGLIPTQFGRSPTVTDRSLAAPPRSTRTLT